MKTASEPVELEVGGRTVRISSPDRVYFSARGETKLDLARYYMSVGDGIVRALARAAVHAAPLPERRRRRQGPSEADPVGRARVGRDRAGHVPPLRAPRRRAVRDRARQRDLGRADVDGRVSPVELAARRRRAPRRVADRHRPDARVRFRHRPARGARGPRGARRARAPSAGPRPPAATGCTSTSGSSRGGASARSARRRWRSPARSSDELRDDATTTWWRKDREPDKVFVDYNQNARDHTIASAYSVRGVKEGTVSTPIAWDEIDDVEPRELHDRHRARAVRPARRSARRHRRCRVLARAAARVGGAGAARRGLTLNPPASDAQRPGCGRDAEGICGRRTSSRCKSTPH